MMNLFDVALEGSKAYSVALEADQIAKAAKAVGLNDEADLMIKSLYHSIKNRNESGFSAAQQLASAVAAKVKVAQEDQKKLGESVSKVAALANYAKDSGFKIDPSHIVSAIEMQKNKNVSGIDELTNLLAADVTRQAISQQKLGDAQAKGKMSTEAQIEANKKMATKLLFQFHTAQKILDDPEAPKAFTAVPKVRAYNNEVGIGNNIKEYMATIDGFNLGQGMQEIKEMTGTGAGMSEVETNAFKAAQSSLSLNQDWANAAESLNIFNAAAIRSLKKLGVRDEYLNKAGAEKWLHNTDANVPLLDMEEVGKQVSSQNQPQASQSSYSQFVQPPLIQQPQATAATPQQVPTGQAQPTSTGQAQPTTTTILGQPVSTPQQQPMQNQVDPYAAIRSKLNLTNP